MTLPARVVVGERRDGARDRVTMCSTSSSRGVSFRFFSGTTASSDDCSGSGSFRLLRILPFEVGLEVEVRAEEGIAERMAMGLSTGRTRGSREEGRVAPEAVAREEEEDSAAARLRPLSVVPARSILVVFLPSLCFPAKALLDPVSPKFSCASCRIDFVANRSPTSPPSLCCQRPVHQSLSGFYESRIPLAGAAARGNPRVALSTRIGVV